MSTVPSFQPYNTRYTLLPFPSKDLHVLDIQYNTAGSIVYVFYKQEFILAA
jgi:hypothetical protein